MDAERWQRLSPLLDALLELDEAARASSLASLREDDPQLADDLEELIALEAGGDDFLNEPLIAPNPGVQAGASVGPYELERMLGEGGMGQVWLARRADGLYQRRVALKLLRPGLADPNLRLRFTRERQILARLEHPHIARLLDAGISSDNQPYLALEYVEGEPITDWCRARDPGVMARVHLFMQVCEAVSHAHTNLIVHRDLKPSNILVTPLDDVRLLDFGIAKLLDTPEQALDHTRTGLRTFTLHYAAPEQIRGEPVTTMTDVYSLGVVLYELLADRKPYQLKRPSDAQWEDAILNVDPQRPSQVLQRAAGEDGAPDARARRRAREVTGDLDNIVLKALSKKPEQRYPSVEALALDLQRWLDGKPVHARAQSMSYRLRKYVRRHRWVLSTAAAVSLVVVSALGIVAWQARQALDESARAQAMQNFVVGLFETAGDVPSDASVDVRQLIGNGERRIERELAHQPLARAELLGVVARLRAGLGDYDQALDVLLRQAALVEALDDAPASLRLQSATDLGRVLRLKGDISGCMARMQPQMALARRSERRLPVPVSGFYSQLGRCHAAARRITEARVLYLRSLGLRRDPLDDEPGIVENLADLASLHAAAGDTPRALGEMRAALTLLRSSAGARHPLAIELLRSLCSLERESSNVPAAERDCREALALATELRGTNHHATIDARRQLAALHVDQGRFSDAEGELRDTLAWVTARLGPRHVDVARIRNSLAIVAWERGELDAALAEIAIAVDIWRERGNEPLLASGLFNQALVLHSAGRDAEALPLLREALALRRAAFGPRHGLVGDTLRLIGEAKAALGDATALEALRQAQALTRGDYGARHSHTRRAEISLARQQALQGDAVAITRLDALAELPQDDAELRKAAWLARAYAADARCRLPGERDLALASLQALAVVVAQAQPEGGTVPREIARLRATCVGGRALSPGAAAAAAVRSAPRRARSA
ncbi:serine/threonine-protein kinase [Luteimonas sp. M1R5S18]|uniref:Serine/threonine-protein kinase n=1 Tax=Luteimonas rhizosphaericola TaxID=3042024 RepID=A0ABT6JIP0_9GAMM|nr:serine/threonine-protein kinase [Luteimonas rhizosphaericola]MDH5830538.1 serine/threonine-protein kinase [Luteimonas rhizosphaericola]